MSKFIKRFRDGSVLEYVTGAFDDWCVYLTRPASNRLAPTDAQYFTRLKQLAARHGANRMYEDFVEIFDLTGKVRDEALLEKISVMANGYGDDALSVDIIFSTVFAGMVAEENKTKTKLGKRVKRLGMHQLLVEDAKPEYAANFSKGKTWREIERECVERGF